MENKLIEVKCIDWFDDHFYKIRYVNEAKQEMEDYLPSVTTKLGALAKPFLMTWYGDIGTREAILRRDEAGERGTRVHYAWATYITGGVVIYNPPRTPLYTPEELAEIKAKYTSSWTLTDQGEMWDLMKLQKFVKVVKPKPVASEAILYDIENREAGTCDNIFDIEEGEYLVSGSTPLKLPAGKYVIDLKTGKSIGEGNLQVACYAKMAKKSGYGEIKGTLILHTQSKNKNGIEGLGVSYQNEKQIEQNYQDYRDISKVWERQFGSKKPVIRQIPGIISLSK